MSRDICVFQDFLTDAYKEKLNAAAAAAGMNIYYFTTGQFDEALDCLQHCEVLYAQSPKLLRAAPATLKWYCSSTAGVDVLCKDDGIFANPDCLLTNSNSFGPSIAEYVIMATLMLMRRWPDFARPLLDHEWPAPKPIRSILGCEVTILGTGNIGCNVAKRMRGMGAARIVGVSRSGTAHEDVFDALYPIDQLDSILPETEVLVMALPGTSETIGILSRERIALLPQNAYVINVGRGTAIDQPALVEALNAERIAGAALDVMVPEPLPQDDPLWSAKNVVLTPHTSGNMTLDCTCEDNISRFCEDLANYAAGRPLIHLVDRKRGY